MAQSRPRIICHMMTTLDGKIASGTDVEILDEYFDLYTQTEDRLKVNSWLLGRVTMQMFAKGEKIDLANMDSTDIRTEDYIVNQSKNGYMFTIDTKGKLRFDKNTVKLSNYAYELPIVVIVTHKTPKQYLKYLQNQQINYIFGGDELADLKFVANKIFEKFSVEDLLLEGGGKINGSFLENDLVDEISLLLVPQVLNHTSAPNLFDSELSDISIKNFKLNSFERVDKDCIWMRYSKA